jgi:hypothetical protein
MAGGRWHVETVYAITDPHPHLAQPTQLVAWIRGRWQIENVSALGPRRHLRQGPLRGCTGNTPQVKATQRNLATSTSCSTPSQPTKPPPPELSLRDHLVPVRTT